LVNQSRGVEGSVGSLVRHVSSRQLAQLVVHQRQELRRGVRVAFFNGAENSGDLAHEVKDTRQGDGRQRPYGTGLAVRMHHQTKGTDLYGRGPAQEDRPSSTARTPPRGRGSNPVGTRTVGPPFSTISIGGAGRCEARSASTMCSGRKAGETRGSVSRSVVET